MAGVRKAGLLATAAVTALVSATQASAASFPGEVRVSGHSPFGGCITPRFGGTLNTQAEVEPWVASNPTNAQNLIGVWQQDRWSNGFSRGLAAGYSFDGGKSWNETALPFSRCAPGGLAWDRASDPWVSIGPDGTAYAVALLGNGSPDVGATAIASATSIDGGKTWQNPTIIQSDTNGNVFSNDKESVTADPTHAGTAYVVWDRLRDAPSGHFRIPTLFSKTINGGRTWSAPRPIAANDMDEQSIGNVILVNPRTHALYDFYAFYFCTCLTIPEIRYVKSTNGGASWGASHLVNTIDALGISDPNTGELVRTEDFAPTEAIDPTNGNLYVAWQTPRFNGGLFDEIAISTSTDDGVTWSPEQRANSFTGRPAFTPTLAVGAGGVVALTYYDFRSLAAGDTTNLPTDYWLRSSRDGGQTLSADQHVAGPFNMKAAPVSRDRGFFIGDYQGLTSVGNLFVPFFVQTNCSSGACTSNRTDVYSARITPLPAGADHATAGARKSPGSSAAPSERRPGFTS
jgi:hypothetical protein